MTDTDKNSEPKEPPRINLGNLSQEESSQQESVSEPAKNVGKTPPPKLKIRPDAQQTPSSKPSEEQPAATEDKPKIKLNLVNDAAPPKAKPKMSDTGVVPTPTETKEESGETPKIKLNLAKIDDAEKKPAEAAGPEDKPAEPVSSEEPVEEPDDRDAASPESEAKKELEQTEPESKAAPEVPEEPPADLEVIEEENESKKGQTIRLDDLQEESLEDLYKAALNATQRVILDEKQKAATGKIAAEKADELLDKAALTESSKKSTARLDLQEMLSESEQNELLKKQTMPIQTDAAPQKPGGTVKIKRPDAAPSASPDTTMAISEDLEESKKSETARIDLPRDVAGSAPPTQRKTIRIKRPDGSGAASRTLTVARTSAGGESSAPSSSSSPKKAAVKIDSDEVSMPSIFAIAAVLAVLVGIAVVYVLAATLSPDLPFPGRL